MPGWISPAYLQGPSPALSSVPRHLLLQEWSPALHAWCLARTLSGHGAVSPQLCCPLRLPSHCYSLRILFLHSALRSPCLPVLERWSRKFPGHPKYSSVPVLWIFNPRQKHVEPCLHSSPRSNGIFRGIAEWGESVQAERTGLLKETLARWKIIIIKIRAIIFWVIFLFTCVSMSIFSLIPQYYSMKKISRCIGSTLQTRNEKLRAVE